MASSLRLSSGLMRERVLRDVSLSVDGYRLRAEVVSVKFPQIEEMKEGIGEIHIEFTVDLPRGGPQPEAYL